MVKNSAIETRESRLRAIATSILNDPCYCQQLKELRCKLGLTVEEVINSYLEYDMDVHAYGNEIYSSLANRFVLHLHNLLKESWHLQRQILITDMLKQVKPSTVIDIGFGVPTQYIHELAIKTKLIKVTLCDLFDMAFQFAAALLEQWSSTWQETISFRQTDMNDVKLVGNFDVYIFQDSIEHVNDPTTCLQNYVLSSPSDSKFILSLPINASVPEHFIVWETEEIAEAWINKCGLIVERKEIVKPNRKVDLFAEVLDFEYKNIVVLCSK